MATDPTPKSSDSEPSQADLDAAPTASGAEPPVAEVNAAVDAVLNQTASLAGAADGGLNPTEIDSALGAPAGASTGTSASTSSTSQIADRDAIDRLVEAGGQASPPTLRAAQAKPVDLQDFGIATVGGKRRGSIDLLQDVEMNVTIELGRARMNVEDVLKLGEGSIVELDKLAGDPVDVLVNDRIVARGEVLILNDAFSVRINEILASQGHGLESQAGVA